MGKKQRALEVMKGEVESTSEVGFAFVFQEANQGVWESKPLHLYSAQTMRVLASISGVCKELKKSCVSRLFVQIKQSAYITVLHGVPVG